MSVKTFLMMGHPGSGKGTQAKLLCKKIGADIYSSGNRLREMAKGSGFVSAKVKEVIDRGDLLPAWFSSHMLVEVLLGLSPNDSVVCEGACRLKEEAHAFDQAAQWLERPYTIIFLQISDSEMAKRLQMRASIEGRADDASDKLDQRLKEYNEKTVPALEFFKSLGRVVEINGEQSVEAVHADILKSLNLA